MNITIVGTGYVGLVTGTCLAESGNTVTCVDIDEAKVAAMQNGHIPIYEPGLEEVFERNIKAGRLSFTTSLGEGVAKAEVIFLALPTPPKEDGSADLSAVLAVASDLGPVLRQYAVVVDKSTVPVGTAGKVAERIAAGATVDFDVVSNPEFLREGFAVKDFNHPDRVVVGSNSERATDVMRDLYGPFVDEEHPIYFMDTNSAELAKYAANSFLTLKISFMNEIANLSEKLGANVDDIRHAIGADERIGRHFLNAGIGYGGSCFPKDIRALHKTAQDNDYDFSLLESIVGLNSHQKLRLFTKLTAFFGEDLTGKTIALWGLAFKPDTDDIREAPALNIIDSIIAAGGKVVAYDPEAIENVRRHYGDQPNLALVDEAYAALDSADALLIATEWNVFRAANLKRIAETLNQPVIFDGRNIYSLETMQQHGFHYESIGRPKVLPVQD
jgi:UDPglucose 6-dehydrogenase